MHAMPLFPFEADPQLLLRHCKLPLHCGWGSIAREPSAESNHPWVKLRRMLSPTSPAVAEVMFDAAFLMPAAGSCQIFLQYPSDFQFVRGYCKDLTVSGEKGGESFTLRSAEVFVEATGEMPDGRHWAIAKPANEPAELSYGTPRPIVRVEALINNFDFDRGNASQDSDRLDTLRVCAAGQTVNFVKREGYEQIKALMKIGAIGPAPLAAFSFDAWGGASEADLANFAYHVAGLCGLVARQHTGIPLLSFLDGAGRPVKRLAINPLESAYRPGYILPHLQLDRGLPQLFEECFENYQAMHDSPRWGTMPNFCRTIEDPMFLDQKCSQLMAGLERLTRNALIEDAGITDQQAEAMTMMELIGAVRNRLGWVIPKHYTTRDRIRVLRNAVSHGGPLPLPVEQVRHDIDKWSLFLMRRVLMRLGFTGSVRSPKLSAQQWAESPVDDFSAEHNTFGRYGKTAWSLQACFSRVSSGLSAGTPLL